MSEGAQKRIPKQEQSKSQTTEKTPTKKEEKEIELGIEFGGSIGATFFIVWSHFHLLYLWVCNQYYNGALTYPSSFQDFPDWCKRFYGHILDGAIPSCYVAKVYLVFLLIQILFAYILPGPTVKGLPIPSQGYRQLNYKCNAASSWYVTLIGVGALYYFKVWNIAVVAEHLGQFTVMSMIVSDILAFFIHFRAFLTKKTTRVTGRWIYDFFMGVELNPRLGILDFKMWAEIRLSWMTLFLITLSCALKFYEIHGYISGPMYTLLMIHFIYSNACMKGEECVLSTWDIFYEKWGWMLIFWNIAGIPFSYTFHSLYLLKQPPFENPLPWTIFLIVLYLFAYYVWDTSQAQRNFFRMEERGTYVKRWTFPQLPWNKLENPKYLQTEQGNKLLLDGWIKYARKIHYTAEIVMTFCWVNTCGYNHFLPHFYLIFLVLVMIHRINRDIIKCKQKYGKDWDEYCKRIPYVFVPGII